MNDLDANPLRGAAEVGMQLRVWVSVDQNFFSAWCHTYVLVCDAALGFDGAGDGVEATLLLLLGFGILHEEGVAKDS